jgi:hypothetical protein
MSAAPAQHIDIQLIRFRQQQVCFCRRDDGEAFEEADA